MPKSLVIVESPAKARTISRFLGDGYTVLASYGHIRDLPESKDDIPEEFRKQKWAKLGVNIEGDFEPLYVVPDDKKRAVRELQSAAKGADTVLLATDEDREGESISWHVLEVLKPKKGTKVRRIVFHEITPEAIDAALKNPRDVDTQLVRAQETRRILDRLYGYTLSPVLWRKVAPKLSAGRVQSVAVRLLVQRERERRDFVSAEYWDLEALLAKASAATFSAKLLRVGEAGLASGDDFGADGRLRGAKRLHLKSVDAETMRELLSPAKPWKVTALDRKPGTENPPEPFMTSTLQQEANRKLGWSARQTMQVAQQLYEGVDIGGGPVGLITYMRTDSLTLAARAVEQAREVIGSLYGKEYLPRSPKQYKSKAKNAQEAHEAIRPTDLSRKPQDIAGKLSGEQRALYDLIWKRTLACQMTPAQVERTRVEVTVEANQTPHVFGASGKRILFPGFLRAYVEGSDDPEADLGDRERLLPEFSIGETLDLKKLDAESHATKPPARYTEATLVRKLEQEGIGRPSTYASILSTIQAREYVFKQGQQLVPTFKAFAVIQLLENHFGEFVDIQFTARMEDELDRIAVGEQSSVDRLRAFYFGDNGFSGLSQQVESKTPEIPFPSLPVGKDPETGEMIVVRLGRKTPFVQRGEGGAGNLAFLDEDLPPADLTLEKALELLSQGVAQPEAVAVDPGTGRCVLYKSGRFGPYLQLAQTEEEEKAGVKPQTFKLPPGVKYEELSEEDLALVLRFPRVVGKHPETGEEVKIQISRYGGFVTSGEQKGNIEDWREAASADLDRAMRALTEKSSGRATRGKPEPLKVLGAAEGLGEIKVMKGFYGPYVTDGTTNATLPRGTDPSSVSLEQAADLIRAKAAAGPSKRRGARKPPASRKRR